MCKKFFLGVVFSYARMQARTHTALEVLAVQQCPGSAELDSILALSLLKNNLYLTTLVLKGISQAKAPVSAKGWGLHQGF